jgi:membrane protease YdiL (CAAX protease family)
VTQFLQLFERVFYNHSESRLRALCRLLIGIALGFLVLGILRALARYILAFLLVMTAQIPFSAFVNTQQLAQRLNTVFERFPLLGGVYSLIILLLVVLAFILTARWIDRRPWRDYGFHFNIAWWRDLGFGLLLGMVLMSMIFGSEYLLGWESIQGMIENVQPSLSFWQLLVDGLIAYVLVGAQEEWFFRGFLIKNLAEGLHRPHINSKAAVLIPYVLISLLFGFAHANNANATLVSSLNLSLIGLLLGLGFILTGELAIPIGLHIAWNFAQGYVFGFPVSGSDANLSLLATQQTGPTVWTGGAFGPEGGLMGLGAALLGVLLIYAWVRWTRRRASVQPELAQYSPLQQKVRSN